jgi:hypothetical protein
MGGRLSLRLRQPRVPLGERDPWERPRGAGARAPQPATPSGYEKLAARRLIIAPMPATDASATVSTFDVTHVRHALQHVVARGACSAYLAATCPTVAKCFTPSVYSPPSWPSPLCLDTIRQREAEDESWRSRRRRRRLGAFVAMIRLVQFGRIRSRHQGIRRLCAIAWVVFLFLVAAHCVHDSMHDDEAGALVCVALVVGVVRKLFQAPTELFGPTWLTVVLPTVAPVIRLAAVCDLVVRGSPPTFVPLRR